MTSLLDSARIAPVTRPRTRKPVLALIWEALGPLLLVAFRWLVASFTTLRRLTLSIAGLGFLCYAAWGWNALAGYAAIGISCLILEALSAPKGDGR